jgi:hypothetical protein
MSDTGDSLDDMIRDIRPIMEECQANEERPGADELVILIETLGRRVRKSIAPANAAVTVAEISSGVGKITEIMQLAVCAGINNCFGADEEGKSGFTDFLMGLINALPSYADAGYLRDIAIALNLVADKMEAPHGE